MTEDRPEIEGRKERLRRFRAVVEGLEAEPPLREEVPGLRPSRGGQEPPPLPSDGPETVVFPSRPSVAPPARVKPRPSGKGRLRDRLLLLVELGALGGLIVVLLSSFSSLRLLNREVAQLRGGGAEATATLPSILPGSSSPPSSEVPAPYRSLMEGSTPLPIPTLGPEQATRIVIPAIGVDAPVVEGDGWEELKMGAGHHIGSANPGERGNMVISGHDDVFGEIFKELGTLEPGHEVLIYAGETPYRYIVREKRVVGPTEVGVMGPTTKATLTLITCYPYLIDTHRLVVMAELEGQ